MEIVPMKEWRDKPTKEFLEFVRLCFTDSDCLVLFEDENEDIIGMMLSPTYTRTLMKRGILGKD